MRPKRYPPASVLALAARAAWNFMWRCFMRTIGMLFDELQGGRITLNDVHGDIKVLVETLVALTPLVDNPELSADVKFLIDDIRNISY
jgi:hypothetical protein